MHLAEQSPGDRERGEPGKTMVHRRDVVGDLDHVDPTLGLVHLRLVLEDVHQGGLGTLDLARHDGLPADVHQDEEVGVGEELGRPVEPAQSKIRGREERLEPGVDGQIGRRERGGDEGAIAPRLPDESASPRAWHPFPLCRVR